MKRVDVVVAVRNEELAIPWFLEQLSALSLPEGVELGVVLVEDSSTDGTVPLLRRLVQQNPRVRYYCVTPGRGQGIAVMYGVSRSGADAIIMMDVDGGHPVEVIPEMIERYLGGAKVVQCVREDLANRLAYRRAGTEAYRLLGRLVFGVDTEEQNVFYRLVSRDVADWLLERPRYWRYLRFPLPTSAGAVSRIGIRATERTLGHSKYGFLRLIGLATDGVLSQTAPSRLAVGLAASMLAAYGLLSVGMWPLALPIVIVVAFAGWRFRELHRGDSLTALRVVECG